MFRLCYQKKRKGKIVESKVSKLSKATMQTKGRICQLSLEDTLYIKNFVFNQGPWDDERECRRYGFNDKIKDIVLRNPECLLQFNLYNRYMYFGCTKYNILFYILIENEDKKVFVTAYDMYRIAEKAMEEKYVPGSSVEDIDYKNIIMDNEYMNSYGSFHRRFILMGDPTENEPTRYGILWVQTMANKNGWEYFHTTTKRVRDPLTFLIKTSQPLSKRS
jgi:hypothetical protein